jgi:hypothetical protein
MNKKFFLLLLLPILLILLVTGGILYYSLPRIPRISITTDKTEYKMGESIKIQIHNESIIPQTTSPLQYEKLVNGDWKTVKQIFCPCGALCELGLGISLKAKSVQDFIWNQKEEYCSDKESGNNIISTQVPSGKYRVTTTIYGTSFFEAAEFTIN